MLMPEIEDIAKAYEDKAIFIKVDVEENDDTAAEFEVECLPTVMIFHNGEVAGTQMGSKIDKHTEFINSKLTELTS